ncbi:hypothetical protein QBC35DRAFT_154844 [Podospora australis]|uniref:Uncharacterized protein n=1 Tax=Podospora australis TaxID=1536484 RepID=A0AAN6WXQ5_9PEZI|nr:hypothetical protein QBC35DRAFT_154844 [Podospora australis]
MHASRMPCLFYHTASSESVSSVSLQFLACCFCPAMILLRTALPYVPFPTKTFTLLRSPSLLSASPPPPKKGQPRTNRAVKTHISIYLPTYPPTYLPTYLPTYPPTYLPTHLPTYLPTYLSVRPFNLLLSRPVPSRRAWHVI